MNIKKIKNFVNNIYINITSYILQVTKVIIIHQLACHWKHFWSKWNARHPLNNTTWHINFFKIFLITLHLHKIQLGYLNLQVNPCIPQLSLKTLLHSLLKPYTYLILSLISLNLFLTYFSYFLAYPSWLRGLYFLFTLLLSFFFSKDDCSINNLFSLILGDTPMSLSIITFSNSLIFSIDLFLVVFTFQK